MFGKGFPYVIMKVIMYALLYGFLWYTYSFLHHHHIFWAGFDLFYPYYFSIIYLLLFLFSFDNILGSGSDTEILGEFSKYTLNDCARLL